MGTPTLAAGRRVQRRHPAPSSVAVAVGRVVAKLVAGLLSLPPRPFNPVLQSGLSLTGLVWPPRPTPTASVKFTVTGVGGDLPRLVARYPRTLSVNASTVSRIPMSRRTALFPLDASTASKRATKSVSIHAWAGGRANAAARRVVGLMAGAPGASVRQPVARPVARRLQTPSRHARLPRGVNLLFLRSALRPLLCTPPTGLPRSRPVEDISIWGVGARHGRPPLCRWQPRVELMARAPYAGSPATFFGV